MSRIVERLQGRIESVFPLPTDWTEQFPVGEMPIRNANWNPSCGIVSADGGITGRSGYPRAVGARYARTLSSVLRTGTARPVRADDPLRRCSRSRRQLQQVDPAIAARFVVETVTFFARHRYLDRDPLPHDDHAIRDAVIHLIVGSLPVAPRHHRRPGRTRTPRKARS